MAGEIVFSCSDLNDRQSIIENRIGLLRIVDQLDGAVPDFCDRSRVTDRGKRRQVVSLAAVPALGDDFGADTRGVTERNGYGPRWEASHQLRLP
jgi:hypothetical protein